MNYSILYKKRTLYNFDVFNLKFDEKVRCALYGRRKIGNLSREWFVISDGWKFHEFYIKLNGLFFEVFQPLFKGS